MFANGESVYPRRARLPGRAPCRYHALLALPAHRPERPALAILTQFIAAEEDALADIGESLRPMDDWSGIESRNIDIAKVTTLHCMLTGDEFEQALYLYEPVYVSAQGVMVLRVADELMAKLALLDEEAQENVAMELAGTLEFEADQWDPEEVQVLVSTLAGLAQQAEYEEQVMFVWMHPLST